MASEYAVGPGLARRLAGIDAGRDPLACGGGGGSIGQEAALTAECWGMGYRGALRGEAVIAPVRAERLGERGRRR